MCYFLLSLYNHAFSSLRSVHLFLAHLDTGSSESAHANTCRHFSKTRSDVAMECDWLDCRHINKYKTEEKVLRLSCGTADSQ